MSYSVREVLGADPKSFVVRELQSKTYPGSTAFFGMDQHSVFWADTKIEGADLATFEYLCSWYSKDKQGAYYMAQRISEDLAHFEVLSYQFVKDSKSVYFGSDVFSDDPVHFARVGAETSSYYKDSKHCWYDIYEIKGADPSSFRFLGLKTAADASHVYHEMNEVEGVELQSYQLLERDFSKDARQVYRQGIRLKEADPATFRILSDDYSLDARHVYYMLNPIPDADPVTFTLVDEFYAKDARRVFLSEKVIEGADPASFRVLNASAGCSCDAHYAYTMEKRIQGVNPQNLPAKACKSCDESGIKY